MNKIQEAQKKLVAVQDILKEIEFESINKTNIEELPSIIKNLRILSLQSHNETQLNHQINNLIILLKGNGTIPSNFNI